MKKILSTLVWFIFLVPAIYLAAIWQKLPAKVPMHFNLKNEVGGYGSRNGLIILVVVLTLINIGVYLLLNNAYRIDPKKSARDNKERMQRIAFACSVFISTVLCALIYSISHHSARFIPGLIFSSVGLLFCFIGNYMYNIKPNNFAGFRTHWTLGNEDNWKKTHLLAGKLFFAGGLLIAIICLLTPVVIAIILFFVITISITIIPGVYSYRLYKKQKNLT